MEQSPELESLVFQLYQKVASGGLFNFARNLYSREDGTLVIGSQPKDRHEGYESIIRFYEAMGAVELEIKVEDIKAHCEDTVGWVIDRVIARLPNGFEVPVRHTYIFHRELEGWKIVHTHISVGIPDEQLLLVQKRS